MCPLAAMLTELKLCSLEAAVINAASADSVDELWRNYESILMDH